MENCVFCKIIKDSSQALVVYEDDNYLAFLDINPINEGHTLLIPKNHVEFVWQMDEENFAKIFETSKKVQDKLQKAINPKTVALAIEGLTVPHTHIHLVPVFGMNELNPNRAKPASKDELMNTYQKIVSN